MDQDRLRAWMNLVQATRLVEDVVEDRVTAATGLTLAQYEVLRRLGAATEGSMRMQDAASLVLLSKSGMTRLVDRLVELGFVERAACASDRRVVYARITDAGRAALEKSGRVAEEAIESAFASHVTDADVRSVRRALRKVLAANGRTEEGTCAPRLERKDVATSG